MYPIWQTFSLVIFGDLGISVFHHRLITSYPLLSLFASVWCWSLKSSLSLMLVSEASDLGPPLSSPQLLRFWLPANVLAVVDMAKRDVKAWDCTTFKKWKMVKNKKHSVKCHSNSSSAAHQTTSNYCIPNSKKKTFLQKLLPPSCRHHLVAGTTRRRPVVKCRVLRHQGRQAIHPGGVVPAVHHLQMPDQFTHWNN